MAPSRCVPFGCSKDHGGGGARATDKLVAFLAARTCDVARVEDSLPEAFAAALADWPQSGIPRAPEAWLLTVARRKLIDAARRPDQSAPRQNNS
jgi:RNA polymerase sigma-70 factor, ECF subfamily